MHGIKEVTRLPIDDDVWNALAVAWGSTWVGGLRARGHHRRGRQDAIARAVRAQAHLHIRGLPLEQLNSILRNVLGVQCALQDATAHSLCAETHVDMQALALQQMEQD